jgi:hypothetical protein
LQQVEASNRCRPHLHGLVADQQDRWQQQADNPSSMPVVCQASAFCNRRQRTRLYATSAVNHAVVCGQTASRHTCSRYKAACRHPQHLLS